MRRSDRPWAKGRFTRMHRPSSRGGFTLIEVVVSTVLLTVVSGGFLMMYAANAGLLSEEYRMERSNYDLSARAGDGQGESTGETLSVEFTMDGQEEGMYPEDVYGEGTYPDDMYGEDMYPKDRVVEVFEQYEVSDVWEDAGNHMNFYRHR